MEEALEALQSEREQKYAVKKELDKRINSESILNLSSFAGFAGLRFGSKKSNLISTKSPSVTAITKSEQNTLSYSRVIPKTFHIVSASNCMFTETPLSAKSALPLKKRFRDNCLKEITCIDDNFEPKFSDKVYAIRDKDEQVLDSSHKLVKSPKMKAKYLNKDIYKSVSLEENRHNGCSALFRTVMSLLISCFTGCVAP
jgi:hypothetical protein